MSRPWRGVLGRLAPVTEKLGKRYQHTFSATLYRIANGNRPPLKQLLVVDSNHPLSFYDRRSPLLRLSLHRDRRIAMLRRSTGNVLPQSGPGPACSKGLL